MDIAAGEERLHERFVAGDMGQQSQLDLRIVRSDESPPLSRHEAAPDIAAELSANRNVLEIGIRRRQPAGARDGLIERRVQPARFRIHQRGQRIEIRALELRELTILQQQLRERVALIGQLLQHGRVGRRAGGRLLENGELELLEQHGPQLRVRVNVELAARGRVDLLLDALPLAWNRSLSFANQARSMRIPVHSMSASTSIKGISISRSNFPTPSDSTSGSNF